MSGKCLAQEHNTMSPGSAQTQTPPSGGKRTNHEVTPPPVVQDNGIDCLLNLSSTRRSLEQ